MEGSRGRALPCKQLTPDLGVSYTTQIDSYTGPKPVHIGFGAALQSLLSLPSLLLVPQFCLNLAQFQEIWLNFGPNFSSICLSLEMDRISEPFRSHFLKKSEFGATKNYEGEGVKKAFLDEIDYDKDESEVEDKSGHGGQPGR